MKTISKSSYALITGASSGIGKEFARIMAQKKVGLILVARRKDKIEALGNELQKKYGVSTNHLALDLVEPSSVQKIYDYCINNKLNVDYLINNAGFGYVSEFIKSPWELESKMIDLNIKALVELTKLFGGDMAKNGHGRILNIASTGAFVPGPRWSVYFASKAFVLSFSEAVATELKKYGVTLTTLCPGPTQSEFGNVSGASNTSLFDKRLPSSETVAKYGIKAMLKGKRVAIHGFSNKITANILVKFAPRWLINIVMDRLTKSN